MKHTNTKKSGWPQWIGVAILLIGLFASVVTIIDVFQNDDIEAEIIKEELKTHMEKNW